LKLIPETKAPRRRAAVARVRERGNAVADRGKSWVDKQEPASNAGCAIGWFRCYRQADGQLYAVLLAAYIFLSLFPVVVVVETYLYRNPGALSDHLIRRLGLTGPAATLLVQVVSGASSNKLGSALIAVADVIIVGLGFGRVLQLAHGRSWGIEEKRGMVTDQLRYFVTLVALIAVVTLFLLQTKVLAGRPSWIGWAVTPLWVAAFLVYFVWVPRLLLHNRVSVRDVLPGALLTVAGLGFMRLLSSFLLTRWLVWYSKYYGGFGVAMALFFWLMIAATILVVAAALSPAVAARRTTRETSTNTQLA
jgi:membrane protein